MTASQKEDLNELTTNISKCTSVNEWRDTCEEADGKKIFPEFHYMRISTFEKADYWDDFLTSQQQKQLASAGREKASFINNDGWFNQFSNQDEKDGTYFRAVFIQFIGEKHKVGIFEGRL